MTARRKNVAAYQVKRSAVKNTHFANKGIAANKQTMPAITKSL